MNIVYMGTPEFAVPSLQALLDDGYRVAAVVTQPDRPKGRKRIVTPSPVKQLAIASGIPVLQPEKLREQAAIDQLASYAPDLIITAAYGQILPKDVLDMPRLGCINVHGSLLPKYRGAAPIQYAIINGELETGVTIMYMEQGLDTGDMISKTVVPITNEDDAGTMFDKLAIAGAELLRGTVPLIAAGTVQATPQRDEEATYARMLHREHERIDWARPAIAIFNHSRALRPWPGAFTTFNGQVIKIWRCRKPESSSGYSADDAPGTIVALGADGIDVRCGDGIIRVTELQPAGKTAMPASDWARSGRIRVGDRLGEEANA